MILLSLSLLLQYDLLQCVEFEKVDFDGLLRAHNQNSSLRNNTPAAYQPDPITPEYAFFTPPGDFHISPTFQHQTRRSQNIHDTQHKIRNNYFKNIFFRHRLRQKHQRFTVLDSFKTSEERDERQESHEKASSYNSREHDTSERSSSESKQKELMYKPVTYTSEDSCPMSKEKAADDSESARESRLLRTRRRTTVSPAMWTRRTEKTTRHKRLIPNILLPVTMLDEKNPDDDADLKKTTPPRSKYELKYDGNGVLKKKKPRKDKHDFFGDGNNIFKTMRPSKNKLEVMRMHGISKHTITLKPATIRLTPTDERFADNDAAIFKKTTPPRGKHKWNVDGNDVLWRKKPHKDEHQGMFGDDDDIFKKMKLRKHKKKPAMRMHIISDTTKKVWYSDRMIVEPEEQTEFTTTSMPAINGQSLEHDRFADNDAAIFKKTTPPRGKHKWNVDGNDVLWRKKPHKDEHQGMFGDDDDIFKKMKLRKHKKKPAMRMHIISDTTKKVWYSDRMMVEPEEETEYATTSMPATNRQSLEQTPDNDWSRYDESNQEQDTTVATVTEPNKSSSVEYLRAPLSKNYFFQIMDHRGEGYMIVFLIELMQIIATKDAHEVHDIVKHADSIIQRQSMKLVWMGHPLLDVTRKFVTMLKVTEITSVQAQAADMHHKLLKRHETLPVVVNTILEYAETMYDDDEGKALFDALRELVTFPKIPLSGYWLCNSIINAFLRPFRRLKDTQQLKELMVSINLELKKQDNQEQPQRSGRGSGAEAGGLAVDNQPPPQKGSSIETGPQIIRPQPLKKRPPWKRKRKHHHRHRKKERDEDRLLFRPRHTQRDQRPTLKSVTPRSRTTGRWLFRDSTYASYLY